MHPTTRKPQRKNGNNKVPRADVTHNAPGTAKPSRDGFCSSFSIDHMAQRRFLQFRQVVDNGIEKGRVLGLLGGRAVSPCLTFILVGWKAGGNGQAEDGVGRLKDVPHNSRTDYFRGPSWRVKAQVDWKGETIVPDESASERQNMTDTPSHPIRSIATSPASR